MATGSKNRDDECHEDLKARNAPPDVIGNAVKVMRIATGEETDPLPSPPPHDNRPQQA